MRRVLQLPGYRRLLSAYTLNELAFQVTAVSLSFIVYRRTGSAFGAAAFYLCEQFLPALVSPFAVARLDQRSPRRVLPALYTLESCLFLALAWVASHFMLAPVLILAALDGVIALTARVLARATTASVTSPAGLLREGNALANTAFSICFMVGPILGGAIVVAGGIGAALLLNSGLFLAMALTLGFARNLPGDVTHRVSNRGRMRAALSHVKERPAIRALLSVQAIAVVFFTISIPVEVIYAQHSLHAGAAGYGVLLSAWGIGAVAGSTVYIRWSRLPIRVLVAVGAALPGVGFLVMSMAPGLAIAVIGAGLAGAGNGIEVVSVRTAIQEGVEERWMALILSFNESLAECMPGIGILLGGALAALATPRIAFATAGIGALAITAAIWIVLAPGAARSAAPLEPSPREPAGRRRTEPSTAPPL